MRAAFLLMNRDAGRVAVVLLLGCLLAVVAPAAPAQAEDRIPVTYAGFSFAGKESDIPSLYPYSSRLVYQAEANAGGDSPVTLVRDYDDTTRGYYALSPEGAAFYRALNEAHYRIARPLARFELKSRVDTDDIGSFHQYGLTTTLVYESVHTVPFPSFNRAARRWEHGDGVMAFFKLAFLIVVLDFRDNSIRDAVPFTCIGKKLYASAPTDTQLLEEMGRLYLGTGDGENGEEGLVTRQLARSLADVSFADTARKTIQVAGVSFGADARAALGDTLLDNDGADYFVSVELSARLASVLHARVMPPLYDNSIEQIEFQNPDRAAHIGMIPPADYLLRMEIASFANAVAERSTSANSYALSADARLGLTHGRNRKSGEEWSRDATVSLGKTRPIPKAMADGWPFGVSYFDALPSLCRGVAERIGEERQAAGWEF